MKVIILGGGIAGISVAIKLLDCASEIVIIEASGKLGGRAKSINPGKNFPHETDYGQHALSFSYTSFLTLLKKVNPSFSFEENEIIDIVFKFNKGKEIFFPLKKMSGTFGKLSALLSLKHLSYKEKTNLIRFFLFIKRAKPQLYAGEKILHLFRKYKQDSIIPKFWEKIAVSIFNTNVNEIEASLFLTTMKKVFFGKGNSQQIILHNSSLDKIFIKPAEKFLLASGKVKILKRTKAKLLEIQNQKVAGIITSREIFRNYDFFVSALPPDNLSEILPAEHELKSILQGFTYSPILTAYIKLITNPLQNKAYLLTESKLDWLFNFGNYVSVVASNALNFLLFNKNELKKEIILELNKFFPVFSEENILDFVLIIKKNSTIMSDIPNNELRKQIYSPYKNFIIAGDWINTALPPTIESAALAGISVSERICFREKSDRTDL